MEAALWYLIGDAVLFISGALVALAFIMSALLIIIRGLYNPRSAYLSARGVFQNPPEWGQ